MFVLSNFSFLFYSLSLNTIYLHRKSINCQNWLVRVFDIYLLIAINCQFLIYCHPLDSKVPNLFQKTAPRKRKQPCFLQYRAAPLGGDHRFIFNEML